MIRLSFHTKKHFSEHIDRNKEIEQLKRDSEKKMVEFLSPFYLPSIFLKN